MVLLLFGQAFAGNSTDVKLPNVQKIIKSLNGSVSQYGNSTLVKRFKKGRLKDIQAIIEGKSKDKRLQEKFNQIEQTYNSRKFQNRVNKAGKEVINWAEVKSGKRYGKYEKLRQKILSRDSTYALVVFLSSSMGNYFDTYLSDMDILMKKQRGKLRLAPYGVLRGLIDNKEGKPSMKTTVLWLASKLKNSSVQVWIDPILFRQYGVNRVPCLVLTNYKAVAGKTCSKAYMGCGYSVFGFLRAVEEKTDNNSLKNLLRQLE